ncbi:MAG: hypothetical protein ACKO4R_00640, partial [Synechococcales cyanobacterium]
FYLKDGKATREVLIYCLITYQNKRVKYYTNRKVHPKHWNPESHQVRKSHPNSTAMNNWLRDIETFVSKIDLAELVATFQGYGFRYVTLDLEGFRSGKLNPTDTNLTLAPPPLSTNPLPG